MARINYISGHGFFHHCITIGGAYAFGFGLMRYPWVLEKKTLYYPDRPHFWEALGMVGLFPPHVYFRSFQIRFLWFTVAVKLPYPLTRKEAA